MDTPADRLKEARRRKGIETAVEAADALQMERTTYQNYEDGSRGFSRHLLKLSRFYRVRPQWLATGQLPVTASEFEQKLNALGPTDQAKVLEYIDLLAAKSQQSR